VEAESTVVVAVAREVVVDAEALLLVACRWRRRRRSDFCLLSSLSDKVEAGDEEKACLEQ
jgi:hypothetical protein